MSITDELNQLITEHGNARDALNVTLAKLRQAQSEIAVLKEAAEQSFAPDEANWWACQCNAINKIERVVCRKCGTPRR